MRTTRISYGLIRGTYLLFFILVIISCKSSVVPNQKKDLNQFLKTYGFAPFKYSNASYGPLTIMKFSKNQDNEIIANPEDCIVINDLTFSSDESIYLLKTSYTIRDSVQAKALLPAGVLKQISFDAGFKNSSYKTIEIELIEPFINYVSTVKARNLFNESSTECKKEIINKNNLVIHKIIGARGIKYKFKNENGTSANLNLEIINKITVSPDFKRQLESNGEIISNQKMYLGFTAFKGRLLSGMVDDGNIDAIELNENEIKEIINGI
ncbi:MAG: hypothetical protein PSV16_11470 [Flavobacterium sp.]|nr:hypothetical protein [Flavobacterium sp.]